MSISENQFNSYILKNIMKYLVKRIHLINCRIPNKIIYLMNQEINKRLYKNHLTIMNYLKIQ